MLDWSNLEVVQCASSTNCDAPCCLKKHVICPTQPDVLLNVTTCQLTDILSLLELVASKMSWQWAKCPNLFPSFFNMLDSCVVENFAVASIISLLGQLGGSELMLVDMKIKELRT
ncbi:PFB0145c isoform X2 [Spatholobus suberectus]|nr:PFB0145c isoform X2 [Spatholobus suberectus]